MNGSFWARHPARGLTFLLKISLELAPVKFQGTTALPTLWKGCTSMNVVSGLPGSVNHAGYFFSAAGFLSQFSRLMNITWIPADGALTSSAGRMPALNSLKSTLWPMDLSFSPS